MNRAFCQIFDKIYEEDKRYKQDAYEFVMDALNYTQKKFKRSKHVTGEELLDGIKDLLIDEFGPMTLTVLQHWGVNDTSDFGNIVFNLVSNKVLSKTDDDKLENFLNGYDFEEVFDRGYRQRLMKKIKRLR